jgi:hypothetical protein
VISVFSGELRAVMQNPEAWILEPVEATDVDRAAG